MLFDLPFIRRNVSASARWKSSQRSAPNAVPGEGPAIPKELYSVDQLNRHAKSLAQGDEAVRGGRRLGFDPLLSRLSDNQAVLSNAYGMVLQEKDTTGLDGDQYRY